jgi:hypothetical protein
MRLPRISAAMSLTVFILSAATVPAAAQTAAPAMAPAATHHAPAVPRANQLVKIQHCSAALNINQSPGYVGPMYGPGWGYRGAYWGDAWGASFYQPPVTSALPQLAIDYTNVSHKTMKQIEFGLVANGILKAEVKDVGTFSPGAEIKHKFGISAGVFPLGTGLPQCPPLRITFDDGTKWRNPMLPPKNEHIYYHP